MHGLWTICKQAGKARNQIRMQNKTFHTKTKYIYVRMQQTNNWTNASKTQFWIRKVFLMRFEENFNHIKTFFENRWNALDAAAARRPHLKKSENCPKINQSLQVKREITKQLTFFYTINRKNVLIFKKVDNQTRKRLLRIFKGPSQPTLFISYHSHYTHFMPVLFAIFLKASHLTAPVCNSLAIRTNIHTVRTSTT